MLACLTCRPRVNDNAVVARKEKQVRVGTETLARRLRVDEVLTRARVRKHTSSCEGSAPREAADANEM